MSTPNIPYQPASPAAVRPRWHQRVSRAADGRVLVTASGDLDLATVPVFEELLSTRLRGTVSRLTVDLSGLTFLGVAGLSSLVRAGLQARCRGIRLVVVTAGNRRVCRALAVTGVDRELEVADSLPPDD